MAARSCAAIAIVAAVLIVPASAGAKSFVGCTTGDGSVMKLRVKPHNCDIFPTWWPTDDYLYLSNVEWSSWRKSGAIGRGHADELNGEGEVKVRLFRRACSSLPRNGGIFSRAKLTRADGSVRTYKLPVQC
jgi:hypothetical protein